MKKGIRIPAIVVSVIVMSATFFLVSFANSYQQLARTTDGRSGLSTVPEDRSFYNAAAVICIGQPLKDYKRKSSIY